MKAVLVLQDHQIMKKMKTPTAISNSHANKEPTHIKENVSSAQPDLAGMELTVSREWLKQKQLLKLIQKSLVVIQDNREAKKTAKGETKVPLNKVMKEKAKEQMHHKIMEVRLMHKAIII